MRYQYPPIGVFKNVCPTSTTKQTFSVVRVRVTRPFFGLRRLLETGEVVQLDEPTALDAVALGRAERI